MRRVDIDYAMQSASNAAALLRTEGTEPTTPCNREAVPEAIRALIAALHSLVNLRLQTEMSLCPNCDGNGYTTHEELTDYHKRDYKTINTDCKQCEKTGRVLITSLTWQKPFTV